MSQMEKLRQSVEDRPAPEAKWQNSVANHWRCGPLMFPRPYCTGTIIQEQRLYVTLGPDFLKQRLQRCQT